MTDNSPDRVAVHSVNRSAPWLIVALVVILAGGAVFWTSHSTVTGSEAPPQKAKISQPQDPAIDQIKQTLSALQQTVQDVQAGEQKLADQISDLQHKFSTDQGERKLLSDQLGALSGRVDALVSTNAQSVPITTPESAPAAPQTQKNKRNKR